MIIISHRGLNRSHPENSISGLKAAVNNGFDGIEFDVRATKDNKLFLMHDALLNRTTNCSGKIQNRNSSELMRCHLKNHEQIPTLDEALRIVKDSKMIIIEIKKSGFENELIEHINKHDLTKKVIIASFSVKALKNIRAIDKRIHLCIESTILSFNALWLAKHLGCEYITCSTHLLRKRQIKKAQNRGLKVFIYTVKSNGLKKKCEKIGVDGIFVDEF